MQKISEYLTRENITLFIAIWGAIGTLINWILGCLRSRKKLSLQIIKICKLNESIVAYMTLQNHSRLPISINNIYIVFDKTAYTGFNIPQINLKIKKASNNEITAFREYTTMSFPVNLGSLTGVSGYILFDIPKEVSEKISTPLTFRVSTNRGNLVQMKLPLVEWTNWEEMF